VVSDESKAPWGHKVTVVIYVEGTQEDAGRVQELVKVPRYPGIDFVGASIETVEEQPKDQVAT
jgi:hypothetical protein